MACIVVAAMVIVGIVVEEACEGGDVEGDAVEVEAVVELEGR